MKLLTLLIIIFSSNIVAQDFSEIEIQEFDGVLLNTDGDCLDIYNDNKGRKLSRGRNQRGNNWFFIGVGQADIAAPIDNPNYVNSVQNAFTLASLRAKREMAEFLGKEIEDEIKKLDEMFQTISEEERRKNVSPGCTPVGPIIKTPTYENRLILYDTFIKGKNLKKQYADYWIQKEVSLERSKEPVCRTSWMLENYYNYFNTELNNKYYLYNRVGNNMRKTNIYRQLEKDILQILNKFNTEEDFHKLLKSIRDVKLMDNKLFWKNNLGTGIDVNELKLMENQEPISS